jgi:hypothetical protein
LANFVGSKARDTHPQSLLPRKAVDGYSENENNDGTFALTLLICAY